jgi:hypothetical protein
VRSPVPDPSYGLHCDTLVSGHLVSVRLTFIGDGGGLGFLA